VQRPIGSGSFGQVFLVVHRLECRPYVMKKIAVMSTMDAKTREATELEVKLLSEMVHPNIVAYRDSFMNHEGHLCIFMEYCEHGDIDAFMQDARKSRRMPEESRLLEWFIQVTLALHALHQKKILHRDLKTQNIFLTGCRARSQFALKLGDFGIAKVLNSTLELAKTQIGTPFYMSPELINNKPYSYKSDIWGLGCVLYEIVNGQRAFDAQSLNGLALKIIKGNYTPITTACSQGTKSLIKSMLSRNPANRPKIKEILHETSIRSKIPQALRMVIAAGPSEAKFATERTMVEQLTVLGLGGLVNCPGPRRDRRRLLQRLEKAERRKEREEEVLEKTAALLERCLREPGTLTRAVRSSSPSYIPAAVGQEPEVDDSSFDGPRHLAPAALEPAPEMLHSHIEAEPCDSQDTLFPVMSHRDRMNVQRERRRTEDEPRFGEAAHRIRSENVVPMRARGQSDLYGRPPGGEGMIAAEGSGRPMRQRARTEDILPSDVGPPGHHEASSRGTSMSWLLDHSHIRKDNIVHPFHNCRPKVVHSPRRPGPRNSLLGPSPPLPHYGEPVPPHAAPPSSMWSGWRSTGEAPPQLMRPSNSVRLESLTADQFPSQPQSEDSDSSGSLSELEDGLSDASASNWDSDELSRRRSQQLQQRIDQCRAAIYRHRMQIEMLQYSFEQEHSESATMDQGVGSDVAVSSSWRVQGGPPHAAACPVPPVVQDCVARLVRRCSEGLGGEKFQAARRCLQASLDAAEGPTGVRLRMLDLLGDSHIGFLSLIDQIVHMERRWGVQDQL